MMEVYLPLLLSSLAFLLSVFSFFYFKSLLKRRTGRERILSELKEEVNSIVKSIDETTDRDISLVEEREKNLKTILEETDRRIRIYIREVDGRKETDKKYAALVSEEPAKKPAATYEALGKKRFGGGSITETPAKTGAETPAPSRSEQIHSFLDAGLSKEIIASRLGISIAEVEFAAALHDRQNKK